MELTDDRCRTALLPKREGMRPGYMDQGSGRTFGLERLRIFPVLRWGDEGEINRRLIQVAHACSAL